MKALTFSTFGNPDVLEYIDIPVPEIKKNEVLIQMKAIGLNYADIYIRKCNYHLRAALITLLVIRAASLIPYRNQVF